MRPKKYLSQVFLLNKAYLEKIAAAVEVGEEEILLEIGAGKGELTQFLVKKDRKIICVEIDSSLCHILKERFKDYPRVEVFCQDIREFTLPSEKIVVVGNIPYHLSFDIINFLIKNRNRISHAYLSFQKEFAEKLCAQVGDKSYSFLSCVIKLYGEAKILFNIPARYFYPRPKVDTSLVKIKLNPSPIYLLKGDEADFLKFLKRVFQERRKKITNILKKIYPQKKKDIEKFLSSERILPSLRPEDIELSYLVEIYNFFK